EQSVDRLPSGEPFTLHPHLQAVTLEIILRAVFGLDEGPRLARMRERLTRMLELSSTPTSMNPALQKPWNKRFRDFVALRASIDRGEDAYLKATINEILRSRPVLPNAEPRLVMEPYETSEWAYPPGCCIAVNAYLVHHDPAIYPDPYVFRPERFLGTKPGTYT